MDALLDAAGPSRTAMEATSALLQPQTKAVVQVDGMYISTGIDPDRNAPPT